MHLVAVVRVVVALGQAHDHAQRPAARDDRRLVDRVRRGFVDRDDRVPRLVIGGHLLLVVGHHHAAALGAHHDLVLGVLELLHRDQALVAPRRQQRRLVDQVGEVGAREARRAARDGARVDVGRQRHLLHVDGQDLLAAVDVGHRHHHLAVEAARAQQRGVEHVGAVGRRDDDDALVGLEAVHLDEELVQRLLALVVRVAEAVAAMAADRVDLVDEDDAGRVLLGLLEHVAHTGCADADEHLDEVRARNGEERHARFTGDGAGEQRLAGAGRADQQRALGNLAAQLGEAARIAQELDDLLQLLARLVDAGDVVEGDAAVPLGQQLGLAFAEAHRPRSAALLHLPKREEGDAQDQHEGQRLDQDIGQPVRLLRRLARVLHLVVLQQLGQRGVVGDRHGREGVAVLVLADDPLLADLHLGHGAFDHLGAEVRIADRTAGRVAARIEHRDDQQQREENSAPNQQAFDPGVPGGLFVVHFGRNPFGRQCRRGLLNSKLARAVGLCGFQLWIRPTCLVQRQIYNYIPVMPSMRFSWHPAKSREQPEKARHRFRDGRASLRRSLRAQRSGSHRTWRAAMADVGPGRRASPAPHLPYRRRRR